MSDSVVIITDRRDAHLPYVEKHLSLPVIIIDPLELLEGASLTFSFDPEGKPLVSYKGQELRSVRSVWYRKPQEIKQENIPVGPMYKAYSQTAMSRLFYLLYNAFPDAHWVSDYYQIVRASDKAWQIAVARQLGMPTLDTVITSDKETARQFIARYPRTVTKPLTTVHPHKEGENRAFFTTILENGFVPDLTNLYLAPAIFQQAVDMVHDVRVAVVGDQVFAASVRADGLRDSKVYDYRLGHYEGKITIKAMPEFPKDLADMCVRHNQVLGVEFGAFDFGQDKNGDFWFFENNPNGQWAFVEKETGQPIGKALAALLEKRSLSKGF